MKKNRLRVGIARFCAYAGTALPDAAISNSYHSFAFHTERPYVARYEADKKPSRGMRDGIS
jgi:hypothetical protein